MRHEKFEEICRAVQTGDRKEIRHRVSGQVGEIVACEKNELFEVDLKGKHRNWARENVDEGKV